MNKKALFYALAYCALYILFRSVIVLGGYSLTTFGYYYSAITGVFLIIPFYVLAIRDVRDRDYAGVIAGREAMRIAVTILAVSIVVTGIYNYMEYRYTGVELAEDYYHSEQYLEFLRERTKTKTEDYPKVIEEQIMSSHGAEFKSTTAKLFPFLLVGLSGAFIVSVIMKRSRPREN